MLVAVTCFGREMEVLPVIGVTAVLFAHLRNLWTSSTSRNTEPTH